MDALGVLDLSKSEFSLDASLFDSHLLSFSLSGDMALRANWSSTSAREFLLAIGGFHPQFTPPAGFPALQRITIDMPSGPVSKLRLAAPATSLGGTHTVVSHVASTTHRQLDDRALAASGIDPGAVRFSIGLEDPEDLISDAYVALESISRPEG